MIIDFHVHTSRHKLRNLHAEKADIKDIENISSKYRIKRIVLLATYFPYKKSGLTNMNLIKRSIGNKLFIRFGSLDAMNNLKEGIKEIDELLKKNLISGIKLYPGYQNFSCSDENIFPLYKLAEKYKVPVMIHTGSLHHCCPKKERALKKFKCGRVCKIDELKHLANPLNIERAIYKFKKVNFVLSHLSKPYFNELRYIMKNYKNVYTDMSGQFDSGSDEATREYKKIVVNEINKFLEINNMDNRILFGSDFPIMSHKDSFEIIEKLYLSENIKNKILYLNSLKLLKLRESEL